jgi:hypothetical protein
MLQLCQLLQPINHPEQGGPIADAPPYNCGKKVTAGPSSDGKSYEFDASGLVTDGLVAVAILPTGPADRVVLNAPDASSLATQPGSSADTSSPAADSTATGADSTPISPGDTASGLPPTIASPSFSDSLPGASVAGPTGSAPALAGAAPASTGTAGGFVPVASTRPTKATPLLVVLFVIGGLAGVALWLYAGRQRTGALLSR